MIASQESSQQPERNEFSLSKQQEEKILQAADEVANFPRAVKLAHLVVIGTLPSPNQLREIDRLQLIHQLCQKSDSISHLASKLQMAVTTSIGVEKIDEQTERGHQREVRAKQEQYMKDAVEPLLRVLKPVFASQQAKNIDRFDLPQNLAALKGQEVMSADQVGSAAAKMEEVSSGNLEQRQAEMILRAAQPVLNSWQNTDFPELSRFKRAVAEISEKAGIEVLALESGGSQTIEEPAFPAALYLGPYRLQLARDDRNGNLRLIDFHSHDSQSLASVSVKPGGSMVVGRSHSAFNFPRTVSSDHVRIEFSNNGSLTLTDIDSTNGTSLVLKRKR